VAAILPLFPRRLQLPIPLGVNHGELFPRVGFIVTNLETPSRAVVRFYNKRAGLG
jgi:hypothetical protein